MCIRDTRRTATTPRVLDQALVRRAHRAVRLALVPTAVGVEIPRLAVVLEIRREQGADSLVQPRVLHRRDGLHSSIEVARHPVGRADIELFVAAVGEVPQPRMLEETADDADDANAIADIGNARTEAADAAHDQIDCDARLRGAIELV